MPFVSFSCRPFHRKTVELVVVFLIVTYLTSIGTGKN